MTAFLAGALVGLVLLALGVVLFGSSAGERVDGVPPLRQRDQNPLAAPGPVSIPIPRRGVV